jgi:hypothetical protein
VEAAAVPDPGQAAGTGISTNVGGREPTGSSLVMTGGEVLIGGEYEKGQILEARVTLEVGEVGFRDKKDPKTGLVVDCTRVHKAGVASFRVERALGSVESSDDA